MRQNERAEAAKITKQKGAAYIKKINNDLTYLEKFASNKAAEFNQSAEEKGKDTVITLLILDDFYWAKWFETLLFI